MDWDRVIDALARGMSAASAALELEQAVAGLDARRELDLHPPLHACLRDAGFGVYAEQRLPSHRSAKKRTRGARADIVITEDGRPLEMDDAQRGLLDEDVVSLGDAGWIEVKCVAQFRPSGPNHAYARAIEHPVLRDVEKLHLDVAARHAAVLLVLFTESEAVADHDVGIWAARASIRGMSLAPRLVRHVAIGDRLGNRVCTLALFPIARPRT